MVGQIGAGGFVILFAAAVAGKVDAPSAWRTLVQTIIQRRGAVLTIRFLVPAMELAVAAAIIAAPPFGLIAGAILLCAFAVVVALVGRNHPGTRCACFGSVGDATLGWQLATRNVLLAVVAAAVAAVQLAGDERSFSFPYLLVDMITALLLLVGWQTFIVFRNSAQHRVGEAVHE
jgi:methylamine utilization protein MauE